MDTRSCRQACKWQRGRTGSVTVCHSTSLHHQHHHMYTSSRVFLRSNTKSSQMMDQTWQPSMSSFTQQDLPFHEKLSNQSRIMAEVSLEELAECADGASMMIHTLMAHIQQTMQHVMFQVSSSLLSASLPIKCSQTTMAPRTCKKDVAKTAPTCTKINPYDKMRGCYQQMQAQFMLVAERVPPVAMVMSCSPVQKLGILMALLIGVVVPHLWSNHCEEMNRRRYLEHLVIYNAADLQKQKQRFQRALSFEFELGDKEVSLDSPRRMAVSPHQSFNSGIEIPQQGSDTMRRQWESFMAVSKSEQVKDVWDARGLPEVGVPTASRKQLEEMTARVRAANTGTSKKDYVSFDELCRGEEDFDAGMADRVAQRKARFQGQFLTDADVGLPSAPKRPSSGDNDKEMAGDRAPGNGRLLNMAGGSIRQQRQIKDVDNLRKSPGEELGSGALLEVRPRQRLSFSASTDGPSTSGPVMEIQPKRSHPRASQDSATFPETSSSQPRLDVKKEANIPLWAQVHSKSPGRPLKLNLSSVDIVDEEFDQSLRLRAALDYVHPSIAPKVAGGLVNEGLLKDAPSPSDGALQASSKPNLPHEVEQFGPASVSMVELEYDESICDRGSDCESALPLFAPVSSVSVGLLKGASMMRRGAEAKRLNILREAATDRPSKPMTLEHLIRRPAKQDVQTGGSEFIEPSI